MLIFIFLAVDRICEEMKKQTKLLQKIANTKTSEIGEDDNE
jgi:hypothetical protein